MKYRLAWASIAFLCPTTVLHAADDVGLADVVIVTATRQEQTLKEAIPHTTVITAQEIRESQAADLPTLLRREASVEFSQNGGLGHVGSVFLRGAGSNQTVILLDGVRIGSAITGTTQLDQIMLDQVERVEIVRGNVSSLYGSEAIGGVIQVFTRRGSGTPAPYASVGYGSLNTRRAVGGYGGEVGDTRFNFSVSELATDGFSALRPEVSPTTDPDRDGYRNLSVSGNVTHWFDARTKGGFTYFSSSGAVQFDDPFAASIDDKQTGKSHVGAISGFLQSELTDIWTVRATASQGTEGFDSFLNEVLTSSFRTTNQSFLLQNDFRAGQSDRLTLGVENLRQYASTTDYSRTQREVQIVFGGYTATFGAHQVQLNARSEDYSDFGRADTYFLGYAYPFFPGWRLMASHGTAFRAPSFNELFFPGFGNPNLRPERAESSELGVQFNNEIHLVRIQAFHTRYRDLIGGFSMASNTDKAVVDGVETSYSGKLFGAVVRASYTIQDPVDDTTGLQLPRRAKGFGSLGVNKSVGAWSFGGEYLTSKSRPDFDAVTFAQVELPGYQVVNLIARYTVDKSLSVALRAENAFNQDYSLASGYNTQPRGFFVTLSYRP